MEQHERFTMRVSDEFLRLVDEWRRRSQDIPGRSEAIRRMVGLGSTMTEMHEVIGLIADAIAQTDKSRRTELLTEALASYSVLVEIQERFCVNIKSTAAEKYWPEDTLERLAELCSPPNP